MTHSAALAPRERRRANTRRRILDAALEQMAAGGIEALSMNALARSLDYTPGALYRYFDSKAALFVTLQLEVIETFQAAVREERARCAQVALDDEAATWLPLLAIADRYQALADEQPAAFALTTDVLGNPRQILDDIEAQELIGPLLTLLADVASLFPSQGPQRAVVLLASIQGVLQLRKLERRAPLVFDTRAMASETTRTLIRGWGADPDALVRADEALAHLNGGTR